MSRNFLAVVAFWPMEIVSVVASVLPSSDRSCLLIFIFIFYYNSFCAFEKQKEIDERVDESLAYDG
jgi:hypothetical protein